MYSVVSTFYPNAIHVLVHKNNKINQIVKCQLVPQPGGVLTDMVENLNAEVLVGGNFIKGELYAQMIATMILKNNFSESRCLILGLGDIGPRDDGSVLREHREELLHVMGLVQESLKHEHT